MVVSLKSIIDQPFILLLYNYLPNFLSSQARGGKVASARGEENVRTCKVLTWGKGIHLFWLEKLCDVTIPQNVDLCHWINLPVETSNENHSEISWYSDFKATR